MVTLYEIAEIDKNLPKKVIRERALRLFSREHGRADADGNPTLKNVAGHILHHGPFRNTYDELLQRGDTGTLDNFVKNAATHIKKGRMEDWEIQAPKWIFYGMAIGPLVGAAVHPDLGFPSAIAYDALELACNTGGDILARGLNTGYGYIIGLFGGMAAGRIYQRIRGKREAEQLSLPAEQYEQTQVRQQNSRRRIRRIAAVGFLAALALFAGHNYLRTKIDKANCEAKKTSYATTKPMQEAKSKEPEVIEVKVKDILAETSDYRPNEGEFVYGIACGEGLPIAQGGRLLPTSQIPYGNTNLREGFLKDNPQIKDINIIPVESVIRFRDFNGDNRVAFVKTPNWECSAYAKAPK